MTTTAVDPSVLELTRTLLGDPCELEHRIDGGGTLHAPGSRCVGRSHHADAALVVLSPRCWCTREVPVDARVKVAHATLVAEVAERMVEVERAADMLARARSVNLLSEVLEGFYAWPLGDVTTRVREHVEELLARHRVTLAEVRAHVGAPEASGAMVLVFYRRRSRWYGSAVTAGELALQALGAASLEGALVIDEALHTALSGALTQERATMVTLELAGECPDALGVRETALRLWCDGIGARDALEMARMLER